MTFAGPNGPSSRITDWMIRFGSSAPARSAINSTTNKHRITHFIPYIGTAMGGPVVGMAGYVVLLADAGYPVSVYCATKDIDGESVRLDTRVRCVHEAGNTFSKTWAPNGSGKSCSAG